MKKVVIFIMLALALSTTAQAGESVSIKDNKLIVIENTDTTEVDLSQLKTIIKKTLDDTIASKDDEMVDIVPNTNESNDTREWIDNNQDRISRTIERVVSISVIGVCFIFLISLLFYFLNHRAKYRAMEKAFESGAPLPPSLGGNTPLPKINPNDAWRTPQAPNAQQPSATPPPFSDAQQPTTDAQPPLPIGIKPSLSVCYKGFRMAAIGLGGMIFFLCAGGEALSGLCFILVLLGAGKAYIAYNDQQNALLYQQQQQRNQVNN